MADVRFFGAHAVRAAFVLAMFGWGVGFYGPPVYLATVVARTGWALSVVSAVTTVHFLAGVVVVASLPRLYARVGLPIVTTTGAMLTAVGVLGWAVAAHPWQLFVAAVFSGAGWVTMGAVPINAIVARWYASGRPVALARAYNGATIGGVVFAPLWAALIPAFGFAEAVAMVAGVMVAVVAWLSWSIFRKTPECIDQRPEDLRGKPTLPTPIWRDRLFVTLAAGMAIGLFAQIGLLAHLFKLLSPTLGAQWAGFLMGGGTACAIAGRAIAAGAVKRIGDRRIVAAASYAAQALGTLALLAAWPDRIVLLVVGIALFGMGIGNATSLPPLVAQTDFTADDVPRVVARIVAISQATYAFAPLLFGLLLAGAVPGQAPPARHEAGPFLLVGAVLQACAAVAFIAGRRSWPRMA